MSKAQLIQKVATGRKYIVDHAHRPTCPVFRHYQYFLQLVELQYGTVNVEQLNVIVADWWKQNNLPAKHYMCIFRKKDGLPSEANIRATLSFTHRLNLKMHTAFALPCR